MSLERFAVMAERDGDTDQRGDPLVPPELVACIQRIVTEAMNAHSAGLALAPTGGGAGTAPPTGSGTGTAPPTGGGSGDGTGRCQSFLLALCPIWRVNGIPLWPLKIILASVWASSSVNTVPGSDGKINRLIEVTPPWTTWQSISLKRKIIFFGSRANHKR